MPPPLPAPLTPEERKQSALSQLQEANLKRAAEEQEQYLERREAVRRESDDVAKRSEAAVREDIKADARRADRSAEWRAEERERSAEIERDRKRREEETRALRERGEERREYEKKRKEYVDSLREESAKKGAEAKREYEANQVLQNAIAAAEREAEARRLQSHRDEVTAKETIVRETAYKRDELERKHAQETSGLHAEESRRHMALDQEKRRVTAQLPAGSPPQKTADIEREFRAKADSLERDMQKRTGTMQAVAAAERRAVESESLRRRTEAEAAARHTRDTIGADLQRKKADLRKTKD